MIAIRVHTLDHCRAALLAARAAGVAVRLVSPRAAPGFAGIGWWRELARRLRGEFAGQDFEAVLDCGPSPGMALAAIRAGTGPLWLDAAAEVLEKVAGIAEQAGIRVECDGRVTLDLLDAPDPGTACRGALEGDFGGTEAARTAQGGKDGPTAGGG